MAQFITDKKIATAKEGFLRVLKIDPTFPQPRFNLGVLAEAEGKREEARRWFEEYLKLDHTSRYAEVTRAKIARLQAANGTDGQPNKDQQYDDYLARARRLISAGLLKEASAEFDQAATLDDSRWEAYAMTAVLLTQQGLLSEAKEFEEKARRRTSVDKKAALEAMLQNSAQERQYREYAQTAVKAFRVKEYSKAAEAFSRAWRLFPQRSEAAFAAAAAFIAAKDYVEAAIILNRLKTSPETAVAQKAEKMLQSLTSKR